MLLGSMPDVDGGIGGRDAYVLNLKAASPPLPRTGKTRHQPDKVLLASCRRAEERAGISGPKVRDIRYSLSMSGGSAGSRKGSEPRLRSSNTYQRSFQVQPGQA